LSTALVLWVVKYVSLTFTSVARNLTPIITIFFGVWMLGEKLKNKDIFMSIVSLLGVILIIIGYSRKI
jgi:drug/metabolite transporter (DMT)-like permease